MDIHVVLGSIAFFLVLTGIVGLFSIASALESIARELGRRRTPPTKCACGPREECGRCKPYVSQSERADRAASAHYKSEEA